METSPPDKHFLEAFRDFLASRTKVELISLGAIVLLVIDLFLFELRATTLLLIAAATLAWWLPCLRTYFREDESETTPEITREKSDFDETDQYGA